MTHVFLSLEPTRSIAFHAQLKKANADPFRNIENGYEYFSSSFWKRG